MAKKKRKRYAVNLTREENLLDRRQSMKNLNDIDKPRKPIAKSFSAEFTSGECPKCFKVIEKGQKVRYNNDGVLIHTRHAAPIEPIYKICDRCFLALPCECD